MRPLGDLQLQQVVEVAELLQLLGDDDARRAGDAGGTEARDGSAEAGERG